MPIAVRNTEKGPTVFSDPPNNIAIEWQGRDDPNGGDVQYVPNDLIENVSFMGAVQRGILEIIKDQNSSEVTEKIQQQVEAYHSKRDSAERVSDEVIDRETEKTIAQAEITEKGEVTHITVPSEDMKNPVGGEPEEIEIPVIIDPLQRGG